MAEDNYSKYRGKCKEYCEELCAKDPSLRLVRGWYDDILWGRQMHWWCVDANGVIIDPTVNQFPSQYGEYIEYNGILRCDQCNTEVSEEYAIVLSGRYAACSLKCANRFLGIG